MKILWWREFETREETEKYTTRGGEDVRGEEIVIKRNKRFYWVKHPTDRSSCQTVARISWLCTFDLVTSKQRPRVTERDRLTVTYVSLSFSLWSRQNPCGSLPQRLFTTRLGSSKQAVNTTPTYFITLWSWCGEHVSKPCLLTHPADTEQHRLSFGVVVTWLSAYSLLTQFLISANSRGEYVGL